VVWSLGRRAADKSIYRIDDSILVDEYVVYLSRTHARAPRLRRHKARHFSRLQWIGRISLPITFGATSDVRFKRGALKGHGKTTILEATQKGDLDITDWLKWFLDCLDRAFTAPKRYLRLSQEGSFLD
jgi:hypothetical protein